MPFCYRCHLPVPERATGGWKTPSHESMNACLDALQEELKRYRVAVSSALSELGIPDENYPAPVANAVDILRFAPRRVGLEVPSL